MEKSILCLGEFKFFQISPNEKKQNPNNIEMQEATTKLLIRRDVETTFGRKYNAGDFIYINDYIDIMPMTGSKRKRYLYERQINFYFKYGIDLQLMTRQKWEHTKFVRKKKKIDIYCHLQKYKDSLNSNKSFKYCKKYKKDSDDI